MLHVKHFGTIGAEKPYKAEDRSCLFNLVRSIGFLVQLRIGRRRRLYGLAGLREIIPDVRFADWIEVVIRDGRAAADFVRQFNAQAVNDGIILHRNYTQKKLRNINGLISRPRLSLIGPQNTKIQGTKLG